jgi:hypothetical protein
MFKPCIEKIPKLMNIDRKREANIVKSKIAVKRYFCPKFPNKNLFDCARKN